MKINFLKNFSINSQKDRNILCYSLSDIQIVCLEVEKAGRVEYVIHAICREEESYYEVHFVTYDNNIFHYYTSCDCPEYEENGYYTHKCRHVLAVCAFLQGKEMKKMQYENKQEMETYVRYCRKLEIKNIKEHAKKTLQNMYDIKALTQTKKIRDCLDTEQYSIEWKIEENEEEYYVSFKVGAKKKYVIKNIKNFIESVQKKEYVGYGKNFGFIHDIKRFDEHSQKVIAYIQEYLLFYPNDNNYRYLFPLRGADVVDRFYELFMTKKEEDFHFSIAVHEDDEILCFEAKDKYRLTFGKSYFYRVNENSELIRYKTQYFELLKIFLLEVKDLLYVPLEDYDTFYETIYRHIQSSLTIVQGKELLPKKDEDISLHRLELYGDLYDGDTIAFRPVAYDKQEQQVNLFQHKHFIPDMNMEMLLSILKEVSSYIMEEENAAFMSIEEDECIQFVQNSLPSLQRICDVYVSDALKKLGKKTSYTIQAGVRLQNNLLEITFETKDFDVNEIPSILKAYKRKKRYTRLKSGQILHLESNQLEDLENLLTDYNVSEKDVKNGKLSLGAYHALGIDARLQEDQTFEIQRDEALKSYIQGFQKKQNRYTLKENYIPVLRNYQKIGVEWILTMYQYQFNGILADEMGLGKTLQMICFMDSVNKEGKCFLVVAPASLIYNWQDEIHRFSKDLTCSVVTGTKAQRKQILENKKKVDILITSYDYLRNDIEDYEALSFDTIILDEAQNIKNHKTKNKECVKKLQCTHRFALSGTPIENSLAELWSIFDFLMPGYLFSYAHFRKQYELEIVGKKDERANRNLKRLISPFILRRTKKDVLKELPDKVDHQYLIDFREEEKKLYFANAAKANKEVQQMLRENNLGKIQILALLTRLRQICCDPRLLFDNIQEPSSKVLACLGLVKTLKENNKKMLIFSSFTSLMELLAQEFDRQEISYYMLSGSTKKEKRKEMVEAFQKDEVPVFLISLKAGGTGLNLTAAEAVIHIDPWWNISAQNQATDRAHRIGQNANVQVYRMIMRDSIEEKIEKLQMQKKDLADTFVEGNDGSLTTMSKEDILDLFTNK